MGSVLSSMVWKLGERGAAQVVSIIVQVVLARILATEDFGTLAILLVFINLAEVLIQKGFVSAVIRKRDATEDDYNTALIVSEMIAVVVYVILFFVSPLIAQFYGLPNLTLCLRVIAISLFFGAFFSIENAILVRRMDFKAVFLCSFTATLVSGMAGIAVAWLGWGIWALVVQTMTQRVLFCIITYPFSKWHPRLKFSKESFNGMFRFGSKVLISEIIYILIEDARTLVIGKRFSTNDLAYYDRGQVYPVALMRGIYDAIASVFLPAFSREQDDKERLAQSVTMVLRTVIFVVAPVFVGFASVAEQFTLVLLTDKWVASVPFLRVFCIYQLALPVYCVLRQALYALGKSGEVLRLEMLKGILFVIAIVVGIFFDPFTVALATTVAMYLAMLSYAVYAHRVVRYSVGKVVATFVRTAFYCIMMFGAVSAINFLNLPTAVLLLVDVLVGASVYILLAFLLRDPVLKECLAGLKGVLKRKPT